MAVSSRHILSQGPVLAAIARVALAAALPSGKSDATAPGPWLEADLPPRPRALVDGYVRAMGGDPAAYAGRVPAHLFPQWALPLATRALVGLPYPLSRTLNAGCTIDQRQPLPAGERLHVRARLESIDDDGKRALLTTRVETGTRSVPDALVTHIRAYVPLARRGGGARAPNLVPRDARELAFQVLRADARLDFAKLTGDFNPIHWLKPAARAAGFKSVILHGFATLARALEAARPTLGEPVKVDARFTRPLPLPARVGVYARDGGLWVGDGPGGLAYLEARLDTSRHI